MENNKDLINLEPEIPNFMKDFGETSRERASKENGVEDIPNLNDFQVTQELIEKSVGKRKCAKKIGGAVLSAALVALLTMSGIVIHNNNNKIDDFRENYVSVENYLENGEETQYYDLEGIGKGIASSILLKSNEDNFDIAYEIVVGLGLACEKVNDLHPVGKYNLNKAFDYDELNIEFDGWIETVYGSMRDTLKEGGLIELPENLRSLLIKFGFDNGVYSYNPITGVLEFFEKENVSDKEMIKSLIAYASSVGITNGNSKGGR